MKKIILLSAMLLGVGYLSAQGVDMMADIPADKTVRVGRLSNGMTYYIKQNAKPEKQAEFYIVHNVGAMQEEDAQVGLAHFLEHMAFNGTKNLPGKMIINYLETIGVKFGRNLNAGTGQELTVYNLSSVPVTREAIVDSALLILHDWSRFITLEASEVEKERGVIIEERRTRNGPDFRMNEKTLPTLVNGTKYAYRDIIGSEHNLRTFPHKELVDFYQRWYRPDLQALIVVGDIDVDAVEAKIKALMADVPAVKSPQPKVVIPIPDNVEPMVCVATDPEQPSTMVTLYIKRESMPQQLRSKVIFRRVDGAIDLMTSMLNQRLSEITQKPNAPFVSASSGGGSMTETCDVIMARAMAREGEMAKAFEALYTEVERVARHGFTQGEFERVVADSYRGAQNSYDNRKDRRSEEYVDQYMNNYINGTAMPDAQSEWSLDSLLLKTATLQEINALAKTLFVATNQVVIGNAPQKEGVVTPSDEDIKGVIVKVRGAAIDPYADTTIKEPLVSGKLKGAAVKSVKDDARFGTTQWTLANGAKVVIKKTDFKSDELMMQAYTRGGLSTVPTDQYATAEMLTPFFKTTGVSKFSANELSKQLSGKAVSVTPYISQYGNGVVAACSPKDVETMLSLVYLNFVAPRLERADFSVMMDRYGAALNNMGKNPNYVFQDSLTATIYDHNPRRELMTAQTLSKVNFDYVAPLYRTLFDGANNFTFLFVGSVDEAVLRPLVERYIGSIPASKRELNWKDEGVEYAKGKVVNSFQMPMQTPKSTVCVNYMGTAPYTKSNIIATSMLKQILDIRCTESVREEKGGTYGVGVRASLSNIPRGVYSLTLKFDTDPTMAAELTEVVCAEVQKIANGEIRAEDISKVKEYMLKQQRDDVKENRYWMGVIKDFYFMGLDINEHYQAAVNAITADDIKSLVQIIVSQGNECIVTMSPLEPTK